MSFSFPYPISFKPPYPLMVLFSASQFDASDKTYEKAEQKSKVNQCAQVATGERACTHKQIIEFARSTQMYEKCAPQPICTCRSHGMLLLFSKGTLEQGYYFFPNGSILTFKRVYNSGLKFFFSRFKSSMRSDRHTMSRGRKLFQQSVVQIHLWA